MCLCTLQPQRVHVSEVFQHDSENHGHSPALIRHSDLRSRHPATRVRFRDIVQSASNSFSQCSASTAHINNVARLLGRRAERSPIQGMQSVRT